jgi:hypothetical protein
MTALPLELPPPTIQPRAGEYQAEVGLLTRRILFTSDAASSTTALGPHTTFWTPDARVSGAGYERWGARNIAGERHCGSPLGRRGLRARSSAPCCQRTGLVSLLALCALFGAAITCVLYPSHARGCPERTAC